MNFTTQILSYNKWTVYLNDERTELQFTNGYVCTYAYLDTTKTKPFFRFDRTIVPKYIQKKALKWAKENKMISIYK